MVGGASRYAVAVVLLAAACGGDGGAAGGNGGTVTVGMSADFQPINSITAGDQYTVELINYALFTPLIQYDEKLGVRPYLAERWDMTPRDITFHLRRDVKWHDGRPVTADDVKFTFDAAKDPATGSLIGSAYLPQVKSAEIVDSFTIKFTFAQPHAQALEDFWWAPMPKHLLQNVAAAELRNAAFNRQPVGSGPYKFGQWQANQRLIIERNPAFPQGLGGPPSIERVVFRVIPEASTLLTELTTGGVEVDIPLPPDQVKQAQSNDQLQVFAFPGKAVYYVGWNNQRPPFNSANVRRALGMAIDRQQIIDALLFGQGAPASSTVPPWHPLFPKDAPAPRFDLNAANQLLEQEGWRDGDGDGIREKGGQPLRFTLMTSDRALNRSVVEVLQSQLRKAGVDAQIRVLEFQTLLAQHKSRDFDAVFTSWVLDNFQMASAPASLFHSRLANVDQSTNRSGVNIPELDRLIDQASAATDENQARGVWRSMTEVLEREQPVTFVYWLNETAAARKSVNNVIMDQRGELVNIAKWTSGRR